VHKNVLASYLNGSPVHLKNTLLQGFTRGFSISNFKYTPLEQVDTLRSAFQHPQLVDEKIKKEVELGRVAGLFMEPPLLDMMLSPVGLQPKKVPGEFRVIHHLSYPRGESINDGIPHECATVTYATAPKQLSILSKWAGAALWLKQTLKKLLELSQSGQKITSSWHFIGRGTTM
jgi:hypothetical protein